MLCLTTHARCTITYPGFAFRKVCLTASVVLPFAGFFITGKRDYQDASFSFSQATPNKDPSLLTKIANLDQLGSWQVE
jgi:hypothetical protein